MLLTLYLNSENADIVLTEIILSRLGKGSDRDCSQIRLLEGGITQGVGYLQNDKVRLTTEILIREGIGKTLWVVADLSEQAQSENSLGFTISKSHDVIVNRGTVFLKQIKTTQNSYEIGYIKSIPLDIRIDGAFADWENKNVVDDLYSDTNNNNIDITHYGLYRNNEMASFFLRVDGMFGQGDLVPCNPNPTAPTPHDTSEPSTPTPSPPIEDPPRNGEDLTYIYIDKDNSPITGYSIGELGADLLIEIRGKCGIITSGLIKDFNGRIPGEWNWIDSKMVNVKKDSSHMESEIELDDFDITGEIGVLFQTTDWSKNFKDYSGQEITRGFPHIFLRGTRYSGDEILCVPGTTPTIDGDYNSGEWSDATSVTNGDLTVYVKKDSTNFYCAVTTADTSEDNGDLCAVYFETDHANDGVDDSYDKRLITRRFIGLWLDEWVTGTASGWQDPPVEPPANHLVAQNLESGVGMEYEFQIPLTTLDDAGNFGESGEKIGFAVRVHDSGSDYEEWPNGALDEPSSNSDSWGEMEIPEFSDLIVPACSMIIGYMIFSKRRKLQGNMKREGKKNNNLSHLRRDKFVSI
jgi:hypothetical protein